jgi:Na+/proline symporter
MITTVVGIIISTADSFLLVPATTLVKDIYINNFKPDISNKTAILLSRIVVLILGIMAYFISRGFEESVGFFERALYAYTIYGVGITPVLMAALFWKKATKYGAISSIISGVCVTILWNESSLYLPDYFIQMNEVIPGIIVSTITLIVGSKITRKT